MCPGSLGTRRPRARRPWLAAALWLTLQSHAQEAAKPPPAWWDQLKDGVGKGVEQVTGGDLAGKLARDVQSGLEGRLPSRVGHVVLGNGRYLTYFEGDPRGFPSTGRPLDRKPSPGEPGARVPLMVVVPVNARNGRSVEGGVVANNADEMRRNGFLIADAAANAAAGAAPAATVAFDPRGNCAAVPPAAQPKYRGRCVSFDPDDPCSALPADGTFRSGQTALAAACDARRDRAVIDKVNAYKPKSRPSGS